MIVGYQGMHGSHTERAAIELLVRAGVRGFELDPCVTSREVVAKLRQGRIELGVLALRNAVAGEVLETVEALQGLAFEEIEHCTLPIIHCLFARAPMHAVDVEQVYSHEQALRQCAANIARLCVRATTNAMEDTALAAQNLARGKYPERTAVICSQSAGEQSRLYLLHESIQDRVDNFTEFVLLKLAG